jgi:transglutaminase-like putative cysteine protease
MYEIRQFRPALYTLIILGITEFALATQSVGIWALACAAVLLNGWLVKSGYFRPLPRLAANGITLLLFVLAALQVRAEGLSRAVLVAGQFLVFLQLVKLFEQRANRDYAQLLVLSLLLVVAASISTASLAFGVVLIGYLFLSLYCCLLFHLKVETDQAKELIEVPDTTKDRKGLAHPLLSRSMRRLTWAISMFSLAVAVGVFLFFPRSTGASLLSALQFQNSQTLTGFSDEVNFQTVAKITQSDEVVAHVAVTKNGKPFISQAPLLLRGTTLDSYSGGSSGWAWSRDTNTEDMFHRVMDTDVTADGDRTLHPIAPGEDLYRQEISLQPTGTAVLFAMPGIVSMRSARDTMRVRYFPQEETLQTIERLTSPVKYIITSRNNLDSSEKPAAPPAPTEPTDHRRPSWGTAFGSQVQTLAQDAANGLRSLRGDPAPVDANDQPGSADSLPKRSVIDPRIEAFARQPEVSGSDDRGPLAARRPKDHGVYDIDAQIARNMEHYLQSNFEYTLDLTDAKRIEGQDPMVSFLYELKRGHCEYFAGAMTLMCQSLGMQARMVVGFKCDEYNDMGKYYVVRQSHAHAWVEVRTPNGWEIFDPTSGRGADTVRQASAFEKVRHFLDFLEYTWANSVVAYNRDSRQSLVNSTERTLVNTAIAGTSGMSQVKSWFSGESWFSNNSAILNSVSRVLTWLVGLLVVAVIVGIGYFFWENLKLRRRAKRMGIDTLPVSERVKLARQLGFYDEMLRLLEKHKIVRPPNLTPMEFSRSITFVPSNVYDLVQRITEVFYRVRYGGAQLSPAQQNRLTTVI